jgi:K(+)-stimulated pyrophosphate-energized sodium pump
LAESRKEPGYKISATDLKDDPSYKALELQQPNPALSDDVQRQQFAQQILTGETQIQTSVKRQEPDTSAFHVLTADSTDPVMGYTVMKLPANTLDEQSQQQNPSFETVGDLVKDPNVHVYVMHQVTKAQQVPGQTTPATDHISDILLGPAPRTYADEWAKNQSNTATTTTIAQEYPVKFLAGTDGMAWAVDGDIPTTRLQSVGQLNSYFPAPVADVSAAASAMKANPGQPANIPPPGSIYPGAMTHHTVPWHMFLWAIVFGLFMAFAIEALTDYYVSTHKRPTQEVAGVSSAGAAPMIIQGFAYAAESSVFMVFAIVVALLVPLFLFSPATYGTYILSFYGIALVGLGLLTTTGYVLAMDTFGPISDNAQGVYEMSGEGHDNEYGSKAVQRLDAAGNTTKALTKGFAIATAVVAAVALFHTYLESAHLQTIGLPLDVPQIFLGLLIGGAAPYLFSAFAINAVGRASFQLINEVRRQFKADAGILAGTSKPDYGRCVAIVTAAAQKELLGPGILAIALPVAVAFGFSIGQPATTIGGHLFNLTGAQALGGYLAGAILSGQLMAVLLANSGGMWDNAKKLIEDGLYGGKGSEAHKAGVVCDTVGDPFKDTAGPALNPLIKVMNLVALLLAPVIIMPFGTGVLVTVTVLAIAALAFSIYFSKKGSMSTALMAAQSEGADAGDHKMPSHSLPGAPDAAVRRKITVEDATGEGVKVDD